MVITDGVHLVSTESERELHEFASAMGLKRDWFQDHPTHPHYDLTTVRSVHRAIQAGAKKVTSAELIKTAWWSRPLIVIIPNKGNEPEEEDIDYEEDDSPFGDNSVHCNCGRGDPFCGEDNCPGYLS